MQSQKHNGKEQASPAERVAASLEFAMRFANLSYLQKNKIRVGFKDYISNATDQRIKEDLGKMIQ